MSKVRIGIVGLGFGRSVLIPAFRAVPEADVVAVAGRHHEHARSVASECGIPRHFSSWEEMVSCPEIDAVCIATPPALHSDIAVASISARKAVFCEKPLAHDSSGARTMWAQARHSGLAHAVDFEFRYIPAWRFLKHLLQNGVAGPLRYVNINWTVSTWADSNRPWSWRSDRSAGGGVLGALAVHAFDYIPWLFGPVRSVSGQLSTRIPYRPAQDGTLKETTAEDYCNSSMLLHDDTPVGVTISNVAPCGRGHWIEVDGEDKTVVLGSENLNDYTSGFEIWAAEKGERLRKLPIPEEFQIQETYGDARVGPVSRLASQFIRSIQSGQDCTMPSFEDGYRSQLLMDSIFRSNNGRRWVDVPAVETAVQE